jgi:hypothetical protein
MVWAFSLLSFPFIGFFVTFMVIPSSTKHRKRGISYDKNQNDRQESCNCYSWFFKIFFVIVKIPTEYKILFDTLLYSIYNGSQNGGIIVDE